MIKGTIKKSEQEYRQVEQDSSSSIKDFATDRRKYYRKYILGEKVEFEETKATIVGSLVDCILLGDEGDFEKKFFVSTCTEPPTGAMLLFTEALYKRTIECMNEEGEVTRPFASLMKDAYDDVRMDRDGNIVAFKRAKADSFEAVVERFIGSSAEHYYQEIREIRPKGLTVVCLSDMENAEKIAEELKTNDITADIFNQETTVDIEVLNQFQVEDVPALYDEEGNELLSYKSMMDKVIVNHKTKTIQIYDLKCTWSVEGFYTEYYLKRKAYIQAYLYRDAMLFATTERPEWKGYEVLPPKFIVCDSINYYSPLIYKLTEEDMRKAFLGFEFRGYSYTGVQEIVSDLVWAKVHDVWRISRKAYENKGIVELK